MGRVESAIDLHLSAYHAVHNIVVPINQIQKNLKYVRLYHDIKNCHNDLLAGVDWDITLEYSDINLTAVQLFSVLYKFILSCRSLFCFVQFN